MPTDYFYFQFCSQHFPYVERFYLCEWVSHSSLKCMHRGLSLFLHHSYTSLLILLSFLNTPKFHSFLLILISAETFSRNPPILLNHAVYCSACEITVFNHFIIQSDGCIEYIFLLIFLNFLSWICDQSCFNYWVFIPLEKKKICLHVFLSEWKKARSTQLWRTHKKKEGKGTQIRKWGMGRNKFNFSQKR